MSRAFSYAGIAIAISCFFLASGASADCGAPGATVSCTGADADGFDAGAMDGIDLTVEDEMPEATVDGGANTEAIRLNDGSSVTNEGEITLGTNDGATISMGDNATITNNDDITATGTDSRAIEVGDNATITNNSTGVITGGADGANDTGVAVWFNGSDDSAENELINVGGTITGGANGAVEGSEGDETISLEAGSTTTGDIRTHGGSDLVGVIGNGSTLTGDVDLGEGVDRMDVDGVNAMLDGNVDGGNGDNVFVVSGAGAEFTGDYTGGDDVDDVSLSQDTIVDNNNMFDLGAGDDIFTVAGEGTTTSHDFDIAGGDGNDEVTFELGADVTNIDLNLGADDDTVDIRDNSTVGGDLQLGAGSDDVEIDGDFDAGGMGGAIFTGNVDLGQGLDAAGDTNTLTIGINATLDGDALSGDGIDQVELLENAAITGLLDLGGGADRLEVGAGGDIAGTIDLGDGNDVFEADDGANLQSDIDFGTGNDRVDILDGATVDGNSFLLGGGSDTVNVFGDSDVADLSGGRLNGTVDLGRGLDTVDDTNTLNLGINSTLGGDALGGDGSDHIFLLENAAITGLIDLRAGADRLEVGPGGDIAGTIDLGDGNDFFEGDDGANLQSDIDLGADGDQVDILDGATVTGTSFLLGGGSDTVNIFGDSDVADMSGASLSGTVDLGQGVDVDDDTNTLNLGINATLTGSVLGGDGNDRIFLLENATVTGQLELEGGNDRVEVGKGADIVGTIELGAGNDVFILQNEAEFNLRGETLMAEDGNDTIIVRGPSDLESDTQAVLTGDVDLGDAGSDPDTDSNLLQLKAKATLDGTVTGGAQVDRIELHEEATITGAVNLGAGADELVAGIDSTLGSPINLGDGNNLFMAGMGADIQSTVDFGSGDDRVELLYTVTTRDEIRTGGGSDTLVVSYAATVLGTIDLGAGDDVYELRPTSALPQDVDLTFGTGDNTLVLGAEEDQSVGDGQADLSAIQEGLGVDEDFERLIIGPEEESGRIVWVISTSDEEDFDDPVVVRNAGVVFDGTVEFSGDVDQQTNSLLIFDLGVAVENSHLDIGGTLNIADSIEDDSGTPDVDESRTTGIEIMVNRTILETEDGQPYRLITTSGVINRAYEADEIRTPDSAVFAFELELDGGNLDLAVTRTATYDEFGANAGQVSLGRYLDDARVAAGASDFALLSGDLDMLSESELETALSQLGAEPYDAHTSSVVSWGRVQQRVLHARPMHCERFTYAPRPEVASTNPCGRRGLMPWAQVVGDMSNHKGGHDRGFDTFGGGVLMGVDHRVSERYWWSADIGFGHVEIENDNDAKGKFQTVDLGVAGGVVFAGIQTRGSVTYSHGFHEIDRRVDFISDTLRGKFDSDRVTVAAETSYRTRVGPVVLEPGVKADFTHVSEESLDEKGHNLVALEVDARKTNLFTVAGGLSISTALLKYRYVGDWLEWADGVWTPMVSAHWRQGFGDVDRDVTAALSGAASSAGDFDSQARDSNGGAEVRGGVTFQPLRSGATVGIYYDGYFGDDVINHSANASVRIPF